MDRANKDKDEFIKKKLIQKDVMNTINIIEREFDLNEHFHDTTHMVYI